MKKIAVLGSTGSIGTQTLEIVRENIVAVLKSVSYQNTMENIVRKDKFSRIIFCWIFIWKREKNNR